MRYWKYLSIIKFLFDIVEIGVATYLLYCFIDAQDPGEKIEIVVIFGFEIFAMLSKFFLTIWAISVTNAAMVEHDLGFDYDQKSFRKNFMTKQIDLSGPTELDGPTQRLNPYV